MEYIDSLRHLRRHLRSWNSMSIRARGRQLHTSQQSLDHLKLRLIMLIILCHLSLNVPMLQVTQIWVGIDCLWLLSHSQGKGSTSNKKIRMLCSTSSINVINHWLVSIRDHLHRLILKGRHNSSIRVIIISHKLRITTWVKNQCKILNPIDNTT